MNIQRSELGAVSNRLNHTVNNLTNISSNLSAARGGIEDADFALKTTQLAKLQVLNQAATAMFHNISRFIASRHMAPMNGKHLSQYPQLVCYSFDAIAGSIH